MRVALLLLLIVVVGCYNAKEMPTAPTDGAWSPIGRSVTVRQITLEDGTECVVAVGGNASTAITCNWGTRNFVR